MAHSIVPSPISGGEELALPQRPLPTGPERTDGVGDFDLSYYWFLLYRRRWLVATITLLATVTVGLFTLALPKKYSAHVIMRVDPQGRAVVGDQASQSGSAPEATLLVSTEAQVITSPAVVSQLIEQLNLSSNREFAPKGYQGGPLTPLQANKIFKAVASDISVGQPIGTLLLDIGFTSHDPNLSAQVANALSHVYLEHEYATRAQALSDASKTMLDQLDTLRAQMERSQQALVDYESSHDVIDPDDKTNIYQARLSQINTALSAAEGARIQLQAEYAVARSGNVDALAATKPGEALATLQERLHADQRQLGQLATIYGPRHPLYVQQQKVVAYDTQLLNANAQHIADRIGSQYRAAAIQEQLIRSALGQEKLAMDAFNMRAIRYHSLKAASDSATTLYYNLQQRIQDATVASGLHSEELRIISPAQSSPIPVFPRPLLYTSLAFFASLGLAIAGVVTFGLMDKTISTPEQVEQRFHCRVIATLPLMKGPIRSLGSVPFDTGGGRSQPGGGGALSAVGRRTPFDEAILGLQSAVRLAAGDGLSLLAVTSSIPAEGKSTISCHLAAAFAAVGTRTVLVDADMRKPNVHRIFHVPNGFGLSQVLRQQRTITEVVQELRPNLAILPAGPSQHSPAELLHAGLPQILDQLRERYEMVIVDCPPVLGLADAAIVANQVEGLLLVTGAGSTEQNMVAASFRHLAGARARILGVVLNRVSESVGNYYSYYKEYSSYYAAADEVDDED